MDIILFFLMVMYEIHMHNFSKTNMDEYLKRLENIFFY